MGTRVVAALRRSVKSRHLGLFLAVLVWIGLISAGASPVRLPTRIGKPETSAAVILRTIAASQIMFATSCGNGGYARTLDQLATPPPGSSDGFFDRAAIDRLAAFYTVTLLPGRDGSGPKDCHGHPTSRAFTATAVPNVFGESGRRSFAVDRDGTIWSSDSPVPPTEPFDRTGKRFN